MQTQSTPSAVDDGGTSFATVHEVPRRRLLTGGAVGGLLGGICCVIGAVAVGLGLAGLSFARDVMERYQLYAMLASFVFIAAWLIHFARTSGFHRREFGKYRRVLLRHVVVMGGAYAVTIGLAVGISAAVTGGA